MAMEEAWQLQGIHHSLFLLLLTTTCSFSCRHITSICSLFWVFLFLHLVKYALVVPWMAYSVYHFMTNKENGRLDYFNLSIIPMQLLRIIHTQFWISLARFQTARSKHRILNKSIDFEQVDRERNWLVISPTDKAVLDY